MLKKFLCKIKIILKSIRCGGSLIKNKKNENPNYVHDNNADDDKFIKF